MQLRDVLELSVRAGLERRLRKHAGVLMPLAIGAMIPGIVHKAIERSRATTQQLDHATYNPMKVAALPPWLALPLAQMVSPTGPAGRAGNAVASTARGVASNLGGYGIDSGKPSGFRGSVSGLGAAPLAGVASGISGSIGKLVERGVLGRELGEKKDPFSMGAGAAISAFGKEMGSSGANLLRDIATKAMDAVGHAGDDAARQAILGDLKRADPVLAGADDAVLMEAYHTMTRFAPVLSTDKNAVRSFLRQAVMSGSGPDYMSIKLLADAERAVTGERKA